MLFTLSAFIVAATPALFQGPVASQAAHASHNPRPLTSRDSARVLHAARRAQDDFETMRKRLLPFEELGGEGGCDATVGRYCYRSTFGSRPTEAEPVVAAREHLLTTLDSLGAAIPDDRWILGQRVRYLMEAERPLAADSIAVACAAKSTIPTTAAWCLALVGYTAQQLGNYPRADAAFNSALEKMPAQERCKWEDVGLVLGRSAGPYRGVACEARDSATAKFWRLVQPLYLNNVNDLRTEFFARITRLYIEEDTKTPMSDWWTRDDREMLLRYGVALWYAQGEPALHELRPRIAGFRREPAFNFFPDGHAFDAPDELTSDDWEYSDLGSRPTYAPLWAASFRPITDQQVALFRRGDSAFVVAAFDVDDGRASSETRNAGAFAAVIDHGGVLAPFGTTVKQAGLGVVSTLVAPWRPFIISLEALNPVNGAAERTRFAPKLPLSGGRLSFSDLLFYMPHDSAPASLVDAIPRALHALRAPSNRQVGVFWETYGVRDGGEPVTYALFVSPEGQNLLHHALVKLHLVDPDRALSVQWQEVPSAVNGVASRGVTVDLSRLKPGRYSVRLTLTSGTDLPIVTERTIEIL